MKLVNYKNRTTITLVKYIVIKYNYSQKQYFCKFWTRKYVVTFITCIYHVRNSKTETIEVYLMISRNNRQEIVEIAMKHSAKIQIFFNYLMKVDRPSSKARQNFFRPVPSWFFLRSILHFCSWVKSSKFTK